MAVAIAGSALLGCQATGTQAGVPGLGTNDTTENAGPATHHPAEPKAVGAGEERRSAAELVRDPSSANTRGQQCNLLVDAVNARTEELAEVTAKFEQIRSNPGLVDEYEAVIQDVLDHLDRLDLADPKVAGFRERYAELLRSSKGLGRQFLAAATDASLLPSVVAKSEGIRETEEELVSDVNGYCQDHEGFAHSLGARP